MRVFLKAIRFQLWFCLHPVASYSPCNTQISVNPGQTLSDHCSSECPYAVTYPTNFSCSAQCVANLTSCQEVDRDATYLNPVTRVCEMCKVPNCRKCDSSDSCNECYPEFSMIKGGSECVRLTEIYFVNTVFIALYVCIGIIFILVLCFGRLRHLAWIFLQWVISRDEAQYQASMSTRCESDDRNNWLAWRLGSATVFESTEMKTRIRKQKRMHSRRYSSPSSKVFHFLARWLGCGKHGKSFGVGMLLLRHTHKFFIVCCVILWLATSFVTHGSDIGSLRACDPAVTKMAGGMDGDICCQPEAALKPVQRYALRMFWFGICVWITLSLLSLLFVLYMGVCIAEYNLSDHNLNQQQFTLTLKNLPKTIKSERRLLDMLRTRLSGYGSIYGVSIVYNIRPWRDQIKEMCDNLIIKDIVSHYDRMMHDCYLRPKYNNKFHLEEQLKTDADTLRELLEKDDFASGEAYVVFNYRQDLKCAIASLSGIPWIEEHAGEIRRSRFVQVEPCTHSPADVSWMDCTPEEGEILRNRGKACFKMLLVFIIMFCALASVYYISILPYIRIGSSPLKHGKSIKVTNNMLGLVNSLLPGIPAGLASGIGFTKFSQQESFVFYNLFAVFAIWILSTMMVQWGSRFSTPLRSLYQLSVNSLWKTQVHNMTMFRAHEEFEFTEVVVNIMVPGQIPIGYLVNEILTALLGTLIPSLLCFVVYIRVCPKRLRNAVRMGLKFQSMDRAGAREVENALQMQPFRLSMEYAFIAWVPLLSFLLFFFVTDKAPFLCGCLICYSVMITVYLDISLRSLRHTSFDSTAQFIKFIHLWSKLLSAFPLLSVWWAMRLGWISPRLGIVFSGMTVALAHLAFVYGLNKLNFKEAFSPQHTSRKIPSDQQLREMDADDRSYAEVLDTAVYSWWNMNPVYVLKCRYCPDLVGCEVLRENIRCWPQDMAIKSLVEPGKEWRFMKPNPKWRHCPVCRRERRADEIDEGTLCCGSRLKIGCAPVDVLFTSGVADLIELSTDGHS